jgi:transposase-like protein
MPRGDQLCSAKLYEHTEARTDQRAGHYERRLHARAEAGELRVPKLRKATFEIAIENGTDGGNFWSKKR